MEWNLEVPDHIREFAFWGPATQTVTELEDRGQLDTLVIGAPPVSSELKVTIVALVHHLSQRGTHWFGT